MSTTIPQDQTYTHWMDTKKQHVKCKIIPSGSYVTGGDIVNFGLLNNPTIKTGAIGPSHADVNVTTPYAISIRPNPINPNMTNWLMKVIKLATGLELAAGPYPADLLADPFFRAYFIFKKYVDLG